MNGRTAALLACAAFTCTFSVAAACGAGWRRTDPPAAALKPRQQVQVWQAGTARRWHAVVITPDAVSGVPFLQAIDCDSCRASLPRTTVDSIRLGNPTAGFWKTVALSIGAPIALFLVLCAGSGHWPDCSPVAGG